MKSFFTKNVLIAITVIISCCLLYWGVEYLKGINLFKPANFYYAHFDKVEGLHVSAPVTINGFQVGQVREINFDYEKNQISVLLSLDKQLRIPVGTTISLTSDLLGTSQLALNLSSAKTYYNVGDDIKSIVPQGLMDKVGTDIMPQVVQILPKVDSILTNVNALTANPALYKSVTRLDAITAQLESSSRQINQLMGQLRQSVPGIMGNVHGVTKNLNETTGNINEMSASLKQLPLDSTVNSLNATVANLRQLSNQLNNKNSTLGLLLNDKSLYKNADSSVASLDSLLKDIKLHPKRYVTIKVF
jgi:phospholipid/cholesterol/gamma-HCH transport system substrate-binding protein